MTYGNYGSRYCTVWYSYIGLGIRLQYGAGSGARVQGAARGMMRVYSALALCPDPNA